MVVKKHHLDMVYNYGTKVAQAEKRFVTYKGLKSLKLLLCYLVLFSCQDI